ncbi:MAG: diaminopimelate epimerase [Prevotella sp.]|nr:diaminopimelate epimerase [Prevotella sp.]
MTQEVEFTKMHGAGNDYIYVNTLIYEIPDPSAAAIKWSAQHTGIGSDGLVLIGKPSKDCDADFSMRIFNADGSEAMMCGNASRCIGKYLFERGLTNNTNIKLETRSGIKTLQLHIRHNIVRSVTVDMLSPRFDVPEQFDNERNVVQRSFLNVKCSKFVSMGNPHYVIFVDDISTIDVAALGSKLEYNPAFPERCNIEFAQILNRDEIRTRVWERGSGITMACGTGACATAVAAASLNLSSRKSDIIMDGGTLHIEWDEATNHVMMTGPAEFVFDGRIKLPEAE